MGSVGAAEGLRPLPPPPACLRQTSPASRQSGRFSTRRAFFEGAFIADEICAPVPRRHLGLTIPRLIRNTFKFDRALPGELHHAAHSPIATWLRLFGDDYSQSDLSACSAPADAPDRAE